MSTAYTSNYLNITSTDLTATLWCEDVIPQPVVLQNFAPDQSFVLEEVTVAEGQMGVDGGYAAGFIPTPKKLSMYLMANSPSKQHLDAIYSAFTTNRSTYRITITITLPSTGERYIFSNGTMLTSNPMSSPKKVLDGTTWKFEFASLEIEKI